MSNIPAASQTTEIEPRKNADRAINFREGGQSLFKMATQASRFKGPEPG